MSVSAGGVELPVSFETGCWLGARAMILPGVTLAEKTLVAAGSVVTKSVDVSCSLVAGGPAVVKKPLLKFKNGGMECR